MDCQADMADVGCWERCESAVVDVEDRLIWGAAKVRSANPKSIV
jgi:hypothetical protein